MLGENINRFKEFLSGLKTIQLVAVIDISTSIFIIGCLINIFTILFSKFLLKKFNFKK